ncbi:nuclear transport factor 2 family protein [Mycobacterium sp. IDR2000157661]|uniref:nuclear transport factor 2 family protein n=1 Tax=Mycobacterium sp. IDR2000157661 TaxID=2867005 RepID=UPI001EEC62EA|nr:nuclear transport factor 2 family protein [Mycobacterium sp. IDR2000157661]ULE32482.1 ketosteroid isomerase family protein [Mycobacterium sp. IDR2000157661]
MAISPADALAAVERSPAAFTVHDRQAWVDAFTSDGVVEDPVGSQPHRGTGGLTAFYDTFIGPRDITFHRDVDLVVDSTVIRDLELEVAMAAGLTMYIPAYLCYRLADDRGEVRIAELQAFWELPAMVGQFARSGARAVPAGLQLTRDLLVNQGPAGAVGFLSGFRGTGARGKRHFRQFLTDARVGDEVAMRRWLGKGARITAGDRTPMSSAELLTRLVGAQPRKVIASGHCLVAGIDRSDGRDVLIADVAAKPFAIERIRYFSQA